MREQQIFESGTDAYWSLMANMLSKSDQERAIARLELMREQNGDAPPQTNDVETAESH